MYKFTSFVLFCAFFIARFPGQLKPTPKTQVNSDFWRRLYFVVPVSPPSSSDF